MINAAEPEEICAVCGNAAAGGRRYSRIYHCNVAFPLCCPMCIDLFQRAPDRFSAGERPQTVLDDIVEEMKWKRW